jgi:SAM-dependent methyltransferase
MRSDLADLEGFYASRQGQLVRRLVLQRIRAAWPDLTGRRVLGLGYALPYLGGLGEAAERVIGLVPANAATRRDGIAGGGRAALADEEALPLPDGAVDRVVLIHALEGCEQVKPMLREVWRVLADGGRLLIVVPNRRGLWTLSDTTPFGVGRPYSQSQLDKTLRRALFEPLSFGRALYVPPVRSRLLLRTGVTWERVGSRWLPHFGGVLVAEAEKSIYAGTLAPEAETRRLPKYLPLPTRVAAARDRVAARERAAERDAVVYEFRPRPRAF